MAEAVYVRERLVPRRLEDVFESALRLASSLNAAQRGEALVREARSRIEHIRARLPTAGAR